MVHLPYESIRKLQTKAREAAIMGYKTLVVTYDEKHPSASVEFTPVHGKPDHSETRKYAKAMRECGKNVTVLELAK